MIKVTSLIPFSEPSRNFGGGLSGLRCLGKGFRLEVFFLVVQGVSWHVMCSCSTSLLWAFIIRIRRRYTPTNNNESPTSVQEMRRMTCLFYKLYSRIRAKPQQVAASLHHDGRLGGLTACRSSWRQVVFANTALNPKP